MKHNEKKMRESTVPRIESEKELIAYIQGLVDGEHDYGTCVYAMSLSAQAAFNYVAHKLGVTGFQASCADLDFLSRVRRMKRGFCIIDYNNLLYPQLVSDPERFPSVENLIDKNKKMLKKAAKELIEENKNTPVSPNVLAHWEKMASL